VLGADRRCIVSPISGTIEPGRPAAAGAKSLTIVSDGSPAWLPLEEVIRDWRSQPRERLEDLLYAAGLEGLPTRLSTAAIGPDDVADVVLNAVAADAYEPSAALLLGGRHEHLAEAAGILRALYPGARLHLAIDDRSERLLSSLRRSLHDVPLAWHRLPARYPQQMEVLLHDAVCARRRAPGASALQSGTLVLDLQKALALRDAVAAGRPAVTRIVALCGPGFVRNPHLRVRIGTPLAELTGRYLLPDVACRVVENSLLRGSTLDPAAWAVAPSCSALIAVPEHPSGELLSFARPGLHKDSYSRTFVAGLLPLAKSADTNLHGEKRPCIACGFCESVCPARIMPHLLHRYVQRDFVDETLIRFGIERCIDCNLCTYVCTSKIDVASLLRAGKEKLAAEGLLGSAPAPEAAP